jgi:multiple sugar transport system substrate-binding protein
MFTRRGNMVNEKASRTISPTTSRAHSRRAILKGAAAATASSLALPAVTGAAGGGAGHGASHMPAQDSVKLQATVWLGDAEFQAMEELGANFTEANPTISVEFINIVDGGPWGRDKLQQMIAGGTPPDLMMMNTGQFEAFGTREALADLDERIAADAFDLGIYWPAAVEGCKIEGKVYGLPKDMSNVIMYLNTDLFEAAGLELPTNEWTWEEFRELAGQLTGDNKWGISINNAAWSWGGFVLPNGGQILNEEHTESLLGSPESIAALQFYFGLLTEDGYSVPPGQLPQTPGSGEQFMASITAMHMAGPWFRPGLVENEPFNWTIRPFPRPGAEVPIGMLYVDQWAMSSTTDNPDEAWALLKFLGGTEGQTIWSEIYGSRSITPIQALAESDAWLGYGGEAHRVDNQTILDQLDYTVPPPTNFGDGAEVENVWNEQFDLVMVEQQDVEQAVQTINESVNSILQGP